MLSDSHLARSCRSNGRIQSAPTRAEKLCHMRLFPRGFAALSSIRDGKACRTIRRLLTPAFDGLGDLETKSRGSEFARTPPASGVAAVAGSSSRRLRPAGLRSRRADRNRCRGVAETDALLSAAGSAGGSLGPLCSRGRRALWRTRAL